MCVCVSVQWVRCLGTFDFCVQWPEFPKLFGGIFVKSLFFGVVVVLSVPVWDVIDLLKYCFQWLKSLSHLWTWIPRNESSKVLVVPVLECEVSVVLVSRSQNVNSQNSFGICLEWYKIPEPFDTCFKAPYFCSFWKNLNSKVNRLCLMVCCIWAVLECVSRLWEIWKYMYFSQEFEVFEICEEFFSMVLGLWSIGVGMGALSQDMMFLSCLNYCIPGRVPSGSDGKESASNTGLIPGSRRSPGEGNGHPLQCSCLENPHGQRSLVGDSPWGHKESDMTD